MEKCKLTDTETMDYVLNLQGEISILSKRVHDIEVFLKSDTVIVENDCEKHLVEANTNSAVYTPNTKLYWSRESGAIMSREEWDKDELVQKCQLEYVGTAKENGFSEKDSEIMKVNPYPNTIDDVIMECFLFHKESRRSRI
jgi:hypothetical protein